MNISVRHRSTFTGYPPEEFYQKPGLLYDLIHPSGKDAYGRQLELLIKGKPAPAAEFQIIARNGNTRWGFFRTTLVRDAAGHPIAVEGIVTDITDRKNEQIAIEETKERLKVIVQSVQRESSSLMQKHTLLRMPIPGLWHDGVSRTEVIGSACNRFFRQGGGQGTETDSGEQVHESERRLMTADGGSMPVIMTSTGKNFRQGSAHQSIHRPFGAEKNRSCLRQIEDRYQAYITTSSEGIFRITADCEIPANLPAEEQIALLIRHGYLAQCNDALARMHGYELATELAGKKSRSSWTWRIPPHGNICTNSSVTGTMVQIMNTWNATMPKYPLVCPVIERCCPEWLRGHLWGVQRDITDRRNAEMTIRESEARYRDLVEHSVEIICTISCSVEITSINPAVLPLLGYLPDEFLKKNIADYVSPGIKAAGAGRDRQGKGWCPIR